MCPVVATVVTVVVFVVAVFAFSGK